MYNILGLLLILRTSSESSSTEANLALISLINCVLSLTTIFGV